jgi:hypothetical protein
MGKEKLCDTESLLLWTAKRQMRLEGGFQVRARSDFFVFILDPVIFRICVSNR